VGKFKIASRVALLVLDARMPQVDLKIRRGRIGAGRHDVVRHIRGKRLADPTGRGVERLPVLIQKRDAVVDVKLFVVGIADGNGDLKVAIRIAGGDGSADSGICAEIFARKLHLRRHKRIMPPFNGRADTAAGG